MIRHGQSIANRDGYFSGNLDVALTDIGREQAALARAAVEALPLKPTKIIHSHLSRARDTAAIINQNLALGMVETPLIGEHFFGDWEGTTWEEVKDAFFNGANPPNGETHDEFNARIGCGLTFAFDQTECPLVVCHGGVFRAFRALYGEPMQSTANCLLHAFTPAPDTPNFPWNIEAIGVKDAKDA